MGAESLERREVTVNNRRGFRVPPNPAVRVRIKKVLEPYLRGALERSWLVSWSILDDDHDVLHARKLCCHGGCVNPGATRSWCKGREDKKARGVDRETEDLLGRQGPFAELRTRLRPD